MLNGTNRTFRTTPYRRLRPWEDQIIRRSRATSKPSCRFPPCPLQQTCRPPQHRQAVACRETLEICPSLPSRKLRQSPLLSNATGLTATVLISIPGVSAYSGLALASRISDIQRFPRPSRLANYWGLTPRCRNSGDAQDRLGSISKEGSTPARHILESSASTFTRFARMIRQPIGPGCRGTFRNGTG